MTSIINVDSLIETPQYHKDILYSVVWDKLVNLPALVIDLRDIPSCDYKKHLNERKGDKIPVMYFTQKPNDVCGITRVEDTEKFTRESIYEYKKIHRGVKKTNIFKISVCLAYYCKMKAKGRDRLKYTKEINCGCARCLQITIIADNGLSGYVYCNECFLAYHLKCEGYTIYPIDLKNPSFKYVCNKCRLYYIRHPEKIGKSNFYILSQKIGHQLQYYYRQPEYHIGCLYEVVWDKKKVYPGIICRVNELPIETFELYLNSDIQMKVPIIYFCAKNPFGLTSYDNLVSFNHDSISSFRKKHTNQDDLAEFQSAVTTAFFCRAIASLDKRLKYLNEDKTGCCGCFSITIDVDNDLDSYVYCDECLLAYHWICAGYTHIPRDSKSPTFKYICKRCVDKHNRIESEENKKRKLGCDVNEENVNKKRELNS